MGSEAIVDKLVRLYAELSEDESKAASCVVVFHAAQTIEHLEGETERLRAALRLACDGWSDPGGAADYWLRKVDERAEEAAHIAWLSGGHQP